VTKKQLEEFIELSNRASSGWHHGPFTGAGHVWVYRNGSPLFEPVFRKLGRLVNNIICKFRSDSYFALEPKELHKQTQNDVEFIIAARNLAPKMAKELLENCLFQEGHGQVPSDN
jgi:hypothetical protein